jgi:hypothetical protein
MEEEHIIAVQKAMNEAEVSVLRAEMYGHGKSDGEFKNHTLYKWVTNALAVTAYAKGLDFVTDLYLCGHSQGGLTVMLAAGLKPEFIRGIIPMSPAVMIPEMARKGDFLGIKFDPELIPEELITDKGLSLSGNYLRAARMIHVEDAISRYQGPVLLTHGDADEVVPYHYSVETAEAYHDARLVTIPDDTHCYDVHLEMVQEAIRQWLPNQVSGAGC